MKYHLVLDPNSVMAWIARQTSTVVLLLEDLQPRLFGDFYVMAKVTSLSGD
jgi:hypothetical protein